jgi:hypothetical protein
MKRILAGLMSGVALSMMIAGVAAASEHEGYEYHNGYSYSNGYVYDDDMYKHNRIVMPSSNNIVPILPNTTVYTNYRVAMPSYNNHETRERYEHNGRYGYDNDDQHREGYEYHD